MTPLMTLVMSHPFKLHYTKLVTSYVNKARREIRQYITIFVITISVAKEKTKRAKYSCLTWMSDGSDRWGLIRLVATILSSTRYGGIL